MPEEHAKSNWVSGLMSDPKAAATISQELRKKIESDRAGIRTAEELIALLDQVAAPPHGEDYVKKQIQNGTRLDIRCQVDGQPVRISGTVTRIFDTAGKPGVLGLELWRPDLGIGDPKTEEAL